MLVTWRTSLHVTEKEEKESTAIKVTAEVKNCGRCVMPLKGENIQSWKSYHIWSLSIPKQNLKGRSYSPC